jgi:hypothetical protein
MGEMSGLFFRALGGLAVAAASLIAGFRFLKQLLARPDLVVRVFRRPTSADAKRSSSPLGQ